MKTEAERLLEHRAEALAAGLKDSARELAKGLVNVTQEVNLLSAKLNSLETRLAALEDQGAKPAGAPLPEALPSWSEPTKTTDHGGGKKQR